MWHSQWMPFLLRPVLGMAAALTLATGFTGAPITDAPHPAAPSSVTPMDGRDDQASRDETRPALQPEVIRALGQRRTALTKASVEIALHERTLQVNEFVAKRAQAEKTLVAAEEAAKYAAKVKELGYDPKTTDPHDIAKKMMLTQYSWGEDQYTCLNKIFTQESNWQWNAENASSGAYGIPQSLPATKMASAGDDWKTNPATQIKWGLKYIKDRYGTPCKAWDFKSGTGWY